MSLSKDITEIKQLFEMPWVAMGSKVVDLELEKHAHNKEAVIAHIRTLLAKYGVHNKEVFVNHLFNEFPVVMNQAGVTREDLI
jgi:predicted regulator of amino acid metabolism with ACT domain